jgi:hypothetical protein
VELNLSERRLSGERPDEEYEEYAAAFWRSFRFIED